MHRTPCLARGVQQDPERGPCLSSEPQQERAAPSSVTPALGAALSALHPGQGLPLPPVPPAGRVSGLHLVPALLQLVRWQVRQRCQPVAHTGWQHHTGCPWSDAVAELRPVVGHGRTRHWPEPPTLLLPQRPPAPRPRSRSRSGHQQPQERKQLPRPPPPQLCPLPSG